MSSNRHFQKIVIIVTALTLMFMANAFAQGMQTFQINGYVYNGPNPVSGATVQIFSWDGKNMGAAPLKTVTTGDGSQSDIGSFRFANVPYDSSKTFSYVVEASKDGQTAYALVYATPDNTPEALPISLDLSMDSWVTDLKGTVTTGSSSTPIDGANITIYQRGQTTGPVLSAVANAVTDANSNFGVHNLPYGLYEAQIDKNNQVVKYDFVVYQQKTNLNIPATSLAQTTPVPNSPSYSPTAVPTNYPANNPTVNTQPNSGQHAVNNISTPFVDVLLTLTTLIIGFFIVRTRFNNK